MQSQAAWSVALPFMTRETLNRLIRMIFAGENAGLRAFQVWLRSLPRIEQ